MGSVTTSKNGVLSTAEGKVTLTVNNETRNVLAGEAIPAGATLFFADDLPYVITYNDGSTETNATDFFTETANGDPAALAEIEALQDLIAAGEDPTEELPETAAGTPTGNQGSSGFVSVGRSGDETLAASGFDTTGNAAAPAALPQNDFIDTNDSPSVLANDSNTIDEDGIATGNVLFNDSDIDTVLTVTGFEVNGTTFAAGTSVTLEGGVFVLNADGNYTFTPNADWNGTVPLVTYTTNTGETATLTITVTPVDDAPIFELPIDEDSYNFSYNENSADSTVIGTVVASDPEGLPITYSIVSGNDNGWFEIDSVTGAISLTPAGVTAVANDFEALANVHSLVVGASDGVNTTNINVTLTELDINEAPEFRSGSDVPGDAANVDAYDFGSLNEGATAGTVVGTVVADDPDAGDTLSYSFEDGTLTNGVFTINATTGVITLNQDIDDADLGTFNFNVLVTDSAGLTDIAAVTIDLNNVNEAPEFRSGSDVPGDAANVDAYDFGSLNEGATAGTVVGTVVADDPDAGDTLSYSFEDGTLTNGVFTINATTGVITLNQDIDDADLGTFNFNVLVTDSAGLTDIAAVTIDLNNVNEAPEFRSGSDVPGDAANVDAYDFGSLNEGATAGTVVGTVIADDPDAGDTLSYSFEDGTLTNGVFTINATTGVITLNQDIDDADLGTFNFNVLVTDSAGLTDIAAVTIDLNNVNEAPEFRSGSDVPGDAANVDAYDFGSLNEGATAGTVVGTVIADDPDAGDTLSYSFEDGTLTNGVFTINATTGVITLNQDIDDADLGTFNFNVLVTDSAGLTDIAAVTIDLNNVNEAPEFRSGSDVAGDAANVDAYDFGSLNEGATAGTVVGTVIADDPDAGDTLSYSFEDGTLTNGVFTINATTGVITLNQDIDDADLGTFNFNVLVTDSAGLTDIAAVTIDLNNVNEAPEFRSGSDVAGDAANVDAYDFGSLNEGATAGTVVGTVVADDPDAGDTLSYSFEDGTLTNGVFTINATTGVITLNQDIDDADLGTFNFNVLVTDSAGLTDIAAVTIDLNNVNEAPEFRSGSDVPGDAANVDAYDFGSLNEGATAGTVVGTVVADDPDAGDTLSYSFEDGTLTNGVFTINATTGVITLNQDIDDADLGTFNFNVLVTDSAGLTDIAAVTIDLNNVNEAPEFRSGSDVPGDAANVDAYDFGSLNEGATAGTVVGTVVADDPDAGDTLSYSFEDGTLTNGVFTINATTGVITLNQDIDDADLGTFNFNVLVTDSAGLTDIAAVTIDLNNVNEAPEFRSGSDVPGDAANVDAYDFGSLNEGATAGTVVGTVIADDPDAGDTLSYSFEDGTLTNGVFTINATTGVITLNQDIDDADLGTFNFNVLVTDSAGLTDIAAVTIDLNNVNEAPEFRSGSDVPGDAANVDAYDFGSLNEGATAGTVVGTVIADDPDAGDTLSYSFEDGTLTNGVFTINATTGVITLNQDIDDADLGTFNFNVLVTDSAGLTDIAAVTIDLNNVNEAPEFRSGSDVAGDAANVDAYDFGSLNEGATAGTVVGTVIADDPDAGDTLSYSFEDGTLTNGVFTINATTGVITLNQDIDDADLGTFNFNVLVTDSAGLTDIAAVTIDLNNVNEAPEFRSGSDVAGDAANVDAYDFGSLNEGATAGTVVGTVIADDPDAGDTLSYSFEDGTLTNGVFTINATTGVITLNQDIDDADLGTFNFNVLVTDSAGLTDIAAVTIDLNNVNEAPEFRSGSDVAGDAANVDAYDFGSLNEGATAGTVVGTVIADDPDAGDTLSYSFEDGTLTNGVFTINATTGVITLNQDIDDADLGTFNFNVLVTDSAGLTDIAAVTIDLNNVNEAPEFRSGSDVAGDAANVDAYDFGSLNEGATAGTVVGTVIADDPDAGDTLSYSFEDGTLTNGVFTINATTGVITLNQDIDDADLGTFNFNVLVTDSAGLTDIAAVTIDLNNVNEAPEFRSGSDVPGDAANVDAYDFGSLNEGATAGTVVGTVVADDPDAGDTLSYSFEDGTLTNGVFTINATTGVITLNQDIDDADLGTFNFNVLVTDSAGLTDIAAVTIDLNNVNEAPEFRSGSDVAGDAANVDAYDFGSLNEGATAGTVVGTVVADDPDAGDTLSYSFEDGTLTNGVFTINATTGVITLNQDIDDADLGTFNFNVLVTDSAGLTDIAAVTIDLNNVNEAPEFRSGSDVPGDAANVDAYDFGSLNEGATAGTVVGTVVADDPDAGDTLSYSFEDGTLTNGVFTINATTGVITLNQDIDDADLGTFNFNVLVTDSAGLTDIAAVTIDLNNVNEAPEFRSGSDVPGDAANVDAYDFGSLNEGATAGTVVGTVIADDPDAGDTLSYSFEDGTLTNGVFTINATTGVITLNQDIDDADLGTFNFNVLVTDSAGLTDIAAVTIDLNNVNEAPEFRSGSDVAGDAANVDAYDFGSLNEGATAGTVVGTVVADDPDAGDTLSYSFEDGTLTNGVFTINATTGVITLNQDIDDADLGTFNFNVLVTDSAGLTDIAAVTIDLNNVNDAPVIVSTSNVAVSEEGLVNGLVDDSGNTDTTNAVVAAGIINIQDDDGDALTVTLSGPTGLTSGADVISWSWDAATKTLTGYTGTEGSSSYSAVMTVVLIAPTGGSSGDWSYQVTLLDVLDHPITTEEDILSLNFGFEVNDGTTTTNGNFNVTVEDDAPESRKPMLKM